jgi:hypothetical protein
MAQVAKGAVTPSRSKATMRKARMQIAEQAESRARRKMYIARHRLAQEGRMHDLHDAIDEIHDWYEAADTLRKVEAS